MEASLFQLQAAAQLPCSGISEIGVNSAIAVIEAAAPKDEIEGALAVQMACTHTAAMAVLAKLEGGQGNERMSVEWRPWIGRPVGYSGAYASRVEVLRRCCQPAIRRTPNGDAGAAGAVEIGCQLCTTSTPMIALRRGHFRCEFRCEATTAA